MKRSSLRSPLAACLFALAAGLGCSDTTTPQATTFSFDRPVDVAFGCYGSLQLTSGGEPIQSAMPTTACATRALPRDRNDQPVNAPIGQEAIDKNDVSWYGLVLESGPGTVHIVQFGIGLPKATFSSTLPDSDPLTPAQNGISVGEEPVAIVTDPTGCHAVTANAGSCDLSILDLDTVFDPARGARVDRLPVKNAAGAAVLARPAAMAVEPPSDVVGEACDPARAKGLVYVAYPSCHLVAGIDAATGTVVTGIQYGASGAPSIVGGDVSCPAECGGGGAAATPGVRPVALDLQVDTSSGRRRLAIGAENSAAITIVDLDDAWRPLSLAQAQLEDPTGTLGVSALALSPEIGMGGGTLGILDEIDDEAAGGTFQFVYAVATDRSVRVADVYSTPRECDTQIDPRFTRSIATVSELAGFPVGAITNPPRRVGARGPGIRLPGDAIPLAITFMRVPRYPDAPANTAAPQPDVPEFRNPEQPSTMIGDFAVITSSSGSTYIANVDDDDFPDLFDQGQPLSVPMPLAMAHQLRDRIGSRQLSIKDDKPYVEPPTTPPPDNFDDQSGDDQSCDSNGQFASTTAIGGPRAAGAPDRRIPAGTIADTKLETLPKLRQLVCDRQKIHGTKKPEDYKTITELQYAAPDDVRAAAFPDLMVLPEKETWSMVWEGSLSLNTGNTNVGGPAIREGLLRVDSYGVHVIDDGRPFCDAGVEPYDILQLRGCDPAQGARDCPSGYTCYVHPDSRIAGLGACMLSDEADRLANACRDFLLSSRRYTVATASTGELLAIPRRYELPTTPLDGCVSDEQCNTLADYYDTFTSSKNPLEECNNNGTCEGGETHFRCPNDCRDGETNWACVADSSRAPRPGTGKRCDLRCQRDLDNPDSPLNANNNGCPTGAICQVLDAQRGVGNGFCMEGVTPPQACINSSQRYDLRAGEAFSVIGDRSGFVHPIVADAAGKCVRDPAASRLAIGRLPLVPRDASGALQACDPTADPLTGQLPGGGFEPNPCATTATTADMVLDRNAATCQVSEAPATPKERSTPAPAVRFRNRGMTFTMVDPYYPGDQTCIADRKGNLGQIPHVTPGYTMSFAVLGGFAPLQVFDKLTTERPSLPVRVVRGPAGSVWVVDSGDFLSSSTGVPSTRGKVLRFDPLIPVAGAAVTNSVTP